MKFRYNSNLFWNDEHTKLWEKTCVSPNLKIWPAIKKILIEHLQTKSKYFAKSFHKAKLKFE